MGSHDLEPIKLRGGPPWSPFEPPRVSHSKHPNPYKESYIGIWTIGSAGGPPTPRHRGASLIDGYVTALRQAIALWWATPQGPRP